MRELINKIPVPWNYVTLGAAVILIIIIAWILTRVNRRVFKRIQKNKNEIHIAFLQRLLTAVIIISCIVLVFTVMDGASSVWQTLLGGTAIISAVLAFAAQDVIKDILAGMMISIHKPFEIGDRIELDNGEYGIVEDMTARHVVLRTIDTLRLIIPNSKINAMQITNMSVGQFDRSIHFRFSVGYDSDVALVKRVIFDAVKESEYSIPVVKKEGEEPAYPPVYFISFAESALVMAVTVYYEKCFSTEKVKNDINTRVREALLSNGVEIPYNYVTVVTKDRNGAGNTEE